MKTKEIIAKIESMSKELEELKQQVKQPNIQEYIDANPINYSGCNILLDKDDIKIELPNCNTDWSYAVWNWVKEFCEVFPEAYPTHNLEDDCSQYQYINIEQS